jgi:hypothetical protein
LRRKFYIGLTILFNHYCDPSAGGFDFARGCSQ